MTEWVDEYLLAGPDDHVCLHLAEPVTRAALRELVDARCAELSAAGLIRGGAVSLRLPPSLTYIVNLLACWRIGAQVSLLDHRLTAHEVGQALGRIDPQVVVSADRATGPMLRGYSEVTAVTEVRDGQPARTGHALLQLSSGSTGPSKVIGRTAADLVAEIERYKLMDGVPLAGERIVLLASMVHVLGLVGGLLYALNAGVTLVLPSFLTTSVIVDTIAASDEPTTVIGVPFHITLLSAANPDRKLPQLIRMTVGGELVRPTVAQAFDDRYGVPLGVMYGMTEVGVIATDLFGENRPKLAPAPGMTLRVDNGELLIARPESPYVGLVDPHRFVDGWLHTKDAGTIDDGTGLLAVQGRLDSQVSIGGLKVDLTEVEQVMAELPGVAEVVVGHDGAIEAFVSLDGCTPAELENELVTRLAAYKRPQRVHVLPRLPRTSSGKFVRDPRVLRDAADRAAAETAAAVTEPVQS
ncbi:MAG: class I adenylate-forming enzyme family protein [Actinocatenispora sp.]